MLYILLTINMRGRSKLDSKVAPVLNFVAIRSTFARTEPRRFGRRVVPSG
jgi:hypothetical protein